MAAVENHPFPLLQVDQLLPASHSHFALGIVLDIQAFVVFAFQDTFLGIDQAKISKITRGQFRDVSEAKMLELAAKLSSDVKIVVGESRSNNTNKIHLGIA